jgi:hypothetical protein
LQPSSIIKGFGAVENYGFSNFAVENSRKTLSFSRYLFCHFVDIHLGNGIDDDLSFHYFARGNNGGVVAVKDLSYVG